MSLVAQHGSFRIPAASSAQIEVAVSGMRPQAVLFWWNGRDSAVDAAGEASHRFGFGWAATIAPDTYAQRCVSGASLHGSDGGETDTYASSVSCIATIVPGTGDPASFESYADALMSGNAFYVNPLVAPTFAAALQVHFLAIGGSSDPPLDGDPDITDLAVGTFEITATGDLEVTDVGFQPDFLAFLSWGSATEDAAIVGGNFALGIAAGIVDREQFVCHGNSIDGADPTDTSHAQERGHVISGDNDPRASLSEMLPNGFRLNVTIAPPSTTKHYYLAIKGGRFRVDELTTSTVDTTALALASVGFVPKAALFVSGTTPDADRDNFSISIGAASGDPVVQGAVLVQDKTGVNPSDVFTALNYANVYLNADAGVTQALEGKVAVTAWGGDGVSLTQTDGDPAATPVPCLLIGEQVASAVPDAYGYLRIGAPIRYVDSTGHEIGAFLESAYAAFGEGADVAVLRVVVTEAEGATLVKVSIPLVPHASIAGGAPYWTGY